MSYGQGYSFSEIDLWSSAELFVHNLETIPAGLLRFNLRKARSEHMALLNVSVILYMYVFRSAKATIVAL